MQIYNFFSNFARICRIFYIKAVSEGNLLFWAASAWAVAYCVVRDCCGYDEGVSDFERKAENLERGFHT